VIMPAPVCLASASPRRKQLLEQIGVTCDVWASNIDESRLSGESPPAYVQRLARSKAEACLAATATTQVIVAADTAVVIDGDILGKPADQSEAVQMLSRLSANWHRVVTGVAVLSAKGMTLGCVESRIRMRAITPAAAHRYWATGEPADKAGAYAIQGMGAIFVERLEGSYSAVVGLPLMEVAEWLAQHGVAVAQGAGNGH